MAARAWPCQLVDVSSRHTRGMQGPKGLPGSLLVVLGAAAALAGLATALRAPPAQAGSLPRWSATTLALPGAAADPEADVAEVTCPSSSTCVAVGGYQLDGGSSAGFIAWGSPQGWSALRAPLPPGTKAATGATLSGVSCASAARCVAVGSYVGPRGETRAYLVSGSGASWRSVPLALPRGVPSATTPDDVSSVACAPLGQCVATGSYGPTGAPLIVTGYGSSWLAASLARPGGGGSAELSQVACPAAHHCTAAGEYSTAAADTYLLTASGYGASWHVALMPRPNLPGVGPSQKLVSGPTALECPAANSCVAAAYYQTTSGPRLAGALLYTSSGTTWGAQVAELPPGAQAAPQEPVVVPSLACARAGACVAIVSYIGDYGSHEDLPLTFLLSENASGQWAPSPLALFHRPGKPPAPVQLKALACEPAGTCVGVGSFVLSPLATATALLTGHADQNGVAWHTQLAPAPPTGGSKYSDTELSRAACSPQSCMAIGTYVAGAGGSHQLLVDSPRAAR